LKKQQKDQSLWFCVWKYSIQFNSFTFSYLYRPSPFYNTDWIELISIL